MLSLLIGLTAGLVSAWEYPGKTDRGLFLGMLSLSALPEFLVGLLLLIAFSVQWSLFPLGGAETPFYRATGWWDQVGDVARHAVLPIVTLTAGNLASLYLFMRNEAIRLRQEPFVEFAMAKGLSDAAVLIRHIGRNSALPLVTIIVMRLAGLVAGSVLVETVYAYPGIGKLLQESIYSRDYPMLHGLFLLITVVILLLNVCAEWLYPKLDPRIRSQNKEETV